MESAEARKSRLLAAKDGRHFAIDRFNTGLVMIATTERLGRRVVSFSLPSGPALFLHLARRSFERIRDLNPADYFDEHPPPQGRWPEDHRSLFDFFEEAIAHVVFSFSALEAFANESIPSEFTYVKKTKTGDRELRKPEIEREVNADEKLSTVLPKVFGLPTPKGKKIWEKYRAIKKLRDRIIHLKTIDRRASGPDDETVWGALIGTHATPYCDHAHQVIGYFEPAVANRRWFGKYPFA